MAALGRTTALVSAAAVMALLAGSGGALALAGADAPTARKVDDFQLADQNFLARHLYKMKDAKAVVLIAYTANDLQVRADAPRYKALKSAFAGKGVEMLMIDSKLGESRPLVQAASAAAGIDMPILLDYQQLVGESLSLTQAGEAIVVDPRTWTMVFRGPVAAPGLQKALDGLVAGEAVEFSQVPVKGGTTISYPEKARPTPISYAKDIAPIVQEKCANCHQPGGIGPMQLNTYAQVKGFAPMIREVIRTQRMPPFGADQTVGHFKYDDRLSPQQIKTLVHWIEAGALRGEGEDPLAKVAFKAPDWPLGKPDIIVDIPAVSIPASGVIDYQRPVVPNTMTEGRWMRAATFRISDRQVVHHILTGVVAEMPKPGETVSETKWGASIGAYGPGRASDMSPPEMGVWVPPSGGVAFQNHYTPYGKATVEKTQMGLYFYPKGQEPKYPRRFTGIFDFGIQIPAGEEYHQEVGYQEIPKDMILYGLSPHAHKRGSAMQISVIYPGGREQMLLALPHYDFNWQYEYVLEEPLKVPAGSKIVCWWTYDNSVRNRDNPDPRQNVSWGEQTNQEMLALHLSYRWDGETTSALRDDYDVLLKQVQAFGMLDDNMDGKLSPAELRGMQSTAIKANFAALDTDHDGFLSKDEYAKASARRRPSNDAQAFAQQQAKN